MLDMSVASLNVRWNLCAQAVGTEGIPSLGRRMLALVRHRAITDVSPRCHRASLAPMLVARLIRRIERSACRAAFDAAAWWP
jgi:hypothetical protein